MNCVRVAFLFWGLLLILFQPACKPLKTHVENGGAQEIPDPPKVTFEDCTQAFGLVKYSPCFGIAVSDLNLDGVDDLVVSNHGQIPSLYINQGNRFKDQSDLLPDQYAADRHGVIAVDLDNDGDRELIFGGGGGDGFGSGQINRLYRNLLHESGVLKFEEISEEAGIAYQIWRTRCLIPVPNPEGSWIDLYMACNLRENCTNHYLTNSGNSDIRFYSNSTKGLNQPFISEGMDLFFDYDRDGDQDLLMILHYEPVIYENVEESYQRRDFFPANLAITYCVAAGDLNNDGYLDLYFGRESDKVYSDSLSFNEEELHFVMHQQEGDTSDRLVFSLDGDYVDIDFIWHGGGMTHTDPSTVFIGAQGSHPVSRRTRITPEDAKGKPPDCGEGIYLWCQPGTSFWILECKYSGENGIQKGKLMAKSFQNPELRQVETFSPSSTSDKIFFNREGRGFDVLNLTSLTHFQNTRSVIMCDLNNDGWVDIAGIRGSEQGRFNGDHFLLINQGMGRFEFYSEFDNSEDDIFQASHLVHGFFNDDGLPDLFLTNGYGLSPGNWGPYRLVINRTVSPGKFVLLELEGKHINRDALGAQVELYTLGDTFLGYRELGVGYNRTQHSHKIHFGLGDLAESKVKARIRWHKSTPWRWQELTVNQLNTIREQ